MSAIALAPPKNAFEHYRSLALFVLGVLLLVIFVVVWVVERRPPDPTLAGLAAAALLGSTFGTVKK